MAKKRLLTVMMTVLLLITCATPIYSEGNDVTVEEVDHAMNTVSNSLVALNPTTTTDAQSLGNVFTTFIDVVRTSGTILTAINGSVTFLRLVGIISDPTQTKLSSILSQLQTIDEKLSSMDTKLDNLTTMMSQLSANVEFNARTQKAISYKTIWKDFEYRYMENGLDKLITEYNSMLRSGLQSWCNGTRNEYNIDNTSIILHYAKSDDAYSLVYSDANITVPQETTDGYVVLKASLLPTTFTYDVNTFNEGLEAELITRITSAIAEQGNTDFEIYNYPKASANLLTEDEIKAIAKDAVNTLVYRVAAGKINNTSNFAGSVSAQFGNYCSHLQSAGDGIDSILKTYFLTSAFEYQIKDDLKDFLDRMIVLTGTYGLFAANVLGMSHLTTDAEKMTAVNQMTNAIKVIEEAKDNSITGYGDYCYITGTRLKYSSITFDASADIYASYTTSISAYESTKGTAPKATIANSEDSDTPIGDVTMIILANTLASNSVTLNHDYLNTNLGNNNVSDYQKIVTSYGAAQTFTIDGKVKLHVKNAIGDYFSNNSTITSLPGDAESEYVTYRKKISGSLYDLSSKALTSNETLIAIATYGENHSLWITDESALMGGPSDVTSFTDSYEKINNGTTGVGRVSRIHRYKENITYNILLSCPCEVLSSQSTSTYRPLVSIQEDAPKIKNQYIIESKEINKELTNMNVNGNQLSAGFDEGDAYDCVIDINDEYSEMVKAELQDANGNKLVECLVEPGSIKVSIPGSYLNTLSSGVHNLILCIQKSEDVEYNYNIKLNVYGHEEPSIKIVNTGVEAPKYH